MISTKNLTTKMTKESSHYTASKEEMIEHIKRQDKIGNEFVEIEMKFIRALASGELYKKIEKAKNLTN